jgi:nitroimidazol reductase NimA-like FMN-containing flavoprotein (pyridoxamine 5'-phosphate oxidase superfamily)
MPLSREEIDLFLAEIRLCHFATVDDRGRPRVRPLWYLWRDGAFLLTTRLEIRHTGRDLGAVPVATLSVASDEKPYRAVIATGRIRVVGKDADLLKDISSRYGNESAWLSKALGEPDRTVLELRPKSLISWDYGRGDSIKQNRGISMRTPV